MNAKKRTTLALLCLYGAVMIGTIRCSSNDDPEPVDCNAVNLNFSATTTNPSGCASSDGSITVTATGGESPYQYSINNGALGSSNSFPNLAAGAYTIKIKDKNGCEFQNTVTLNSTASTLSVSISANQAGCKTNNGSITVNASGGTGSYEYRLNSGSFGAANEFAGLGAATYSITVKDSDGCIASASATLRSGITFDADIKTIIDTNCAVSGCHVTGGDAPMSLQTYTAAKNSAANIKTKVLDGSMPKNGTPLSQELKDKIACWADDGAPQN